MNYKLELIDSGKRMLDSGLTVGTWGNISIKDPDTGRIYLTPSGMDYESLTPDDIVVMDGEQRVIEGKRKPTIEYLMHLRIQNRRPDVRVVIHTHPIYSQIFACLNEDIPPCIDEAAQSFGGPVRCAPYALPGSLELAQQVDEVLGDGYACLLANHGAVCVGSDVESAFRNCAVLEMTAQIYYAARSIGTPVILDEKTVRANREFILNRYGQR